MNSLKISTNSNPSSVAGAITELMKVQEKLELHMIGAGAVNQAVKAIAIARGFVAPLGVELVCIPAFMRTSINGEEATGINLIIRKGSVK